MRESETIHSITKGYPPKKHLLRDLSISVAMHGKDLATVRAPVVPEICTDHGVIHVGVLATLVDVVGGLIALNVAAPDWMSTASLSIHTLTGVSSGMVSGKGFVIRSGRKTVAIGAEIQTEKAPGQDVMKTIGTAMITYSRLTKSQADLQVGSLRPQADVIRFSLRNSRLDKHIIETAGIRLVDEATGRLVLNMHDYVQNSLGSLQGGMVALLADLAGQYAARAATGDMLNTCDLIIHYISPGKAGPFETSAEVLRTEDTHALTRIRVVDAGDDNRLMAVVMHTAGYCIKGL